MHSVSPVEKIGGGGGGGSLRHVGEGALDDSDSSSGSGKADGKDATGDDRESNDGERSLPSSGIAPTRTIPAPSPLSRVAGRQHWTGDEEDEEQEYNDEDDASPSPGSTDTDSTSSSSPPRRRKSSSSNNSKTRRQVKRIKSRSRSSTVALLAAPSPPRLTHQYSSSSIRTVTAGERELERDEHGLKGEGTFRDLRGGMRPHARSEAGLDSVMGHGNGVEGAEGAGMEDADAGNLTDRLLEVVRVDEKRFRELAWDALREALEEFADEVRMFDCVLMYSIDESSGRRSNVCHACIDCT